jgi:hypothetical protein
VVTPTQPTALQFTVATETSRRFLWPAVGQLTSYFGRGHTTGIDIGLDSSTDSPIRASAGGTVTFAGGSSCCGYGYYAVVDHGDGYSTLYGHLEELAVKTGRELEQGDLIGLGGSSGNSDGKHLHFEIMLNEQYLDPLRFLAQVQGLPSRQTRAMSCPVDTLAIGPDSTLSLRFTSGTLDGYQVEHVSLVPLGAVIGAPEVNARSDGQRRVTVEVAALPAASGRIYEYALGVNFGRGADKAVADCTLLLHTLPSYPELNRVATATPPPRPRPTMIHTRTPTPVFSGPGAIRTATPTPRPGQPPALSGSRTPAVSGTPTRTTGTPVTSSSPVRQGTPGR